MVGGESRVWEVPNCYQERKQVQGQEGSLQGTGQGQVTSWEPPRPRPLDPSLLKDPQGKSHPVKRASGGRFSEAGVLASVFQVETVTLH